MKTIWADLQAYPGYQVSHDGRVRDQHKNVLAVRLDEDGCAAVRMWVNGLREVLPVYVLVGYGFHGKPTAGFRVLARLDGDVRNDHADNLVWTEPPIDYEQLMRAPAHRGYPARIDASALTLICSEYSAHWGTNICKGN
jgi:hypothetical protein